MIQQLAASGSQIPATPELDAIRANCAKAEQAEAQVGADAPRDADYGWAYEPLSQTKHPVYSAKIVTPKGCLSRVSDIASYGAAYR